MATNLPDSPPLRLDAEAIEITSRVAGRVPAGGSPLRGARSKWRPEHLDIKKVCRYLEWLHTPRGRSSDLRGSD